MTERTDITKKRSGPLGISGGTWRLLIIPVLLCMILPLGVSAFMFRNDSAHTGIYNDGGTPPNNVPLWNYSFGDYNYTLPIPVDNSTYASPAVVNGVVYMGSLSNVMAAFDATTGQKLREYATEGDIHASAAVVNNVVYFTSYDHNLYALNTNDFSLRWAADIGAPGHSSPAVVGGFVYVGSDNGTVFKFNADTGAKIWNNQTNTTPTASNTMHSSPAVVNNVVYIGNENGNVSALNATTGAFIWNRTTGGMVYSSPAVVNNVVYVGSNDGNLYMLNTANGNDVHTPFPTAGGVLSSPAVANCVVYVGSNDGGLYAIDASTGVQNWMYPTLSDVLSSPAVANGRVYVGSYNSNLYSIDVNGTKIWEYSTGSYAPGFGLFSSPAVATGVVYVGGGEGNTLLWAIGNQTPPVQAPVAAFTSDVRNGTVPLTVQFTNQSTGTPPLTYAWDFTNDGIIDNTTPSPAYTYNSVGVFTVNLTVTNSAGSNSSVKTAWINVTAAPVLNATATTGVYRPGVGFYLKMDNGSTWNPSTDKYLAWDNAAADLPVAGDFNKDGQAETGVYRPGVGFYLKMDNGSTWNPSTDKYLAWDNAVGDRPVAGDWNGDGFAETGVYRPGVGFYLKMDNGSTWTPSTDKYLAWDNAAVDLPIAGKFV